MRQKPSEPTRDPPAPNSLTRAFILKRRSNNVRRTVRTRTCGSVLPGAGREEHLPVLVLVPSGPGHLQPPAARATSPVEPELSRWFGSSVCVSKATQAARGHFRLANQSARSRSDQQSEGAEPGGSEPKSGTTPLRVHCGVIRVLLLKYFYSRDGSEKWTGSDVGPVHF